jgi:hypothetical protein
MNELVNKFKSNKVVKFTQVDSNGNPLNLLDTKGYKINPTSYRKIIRFSDNGFYSFSNLITNRLSIYRSIPESRVDLDNGYIEKIVHKKYGTKYIKVEFLMEFPKFNKKAS